MSTKSGKKRKAPDNNKNEETNKFQSIVKAFTENQQKFFEEWIACNGIASDDPVEGAEDITSKERGIFTDEMASLFDGYMYDTILHLEKDEDGNFFVPTLKSRPDPIKGATFFEEVEDGPLAFISPNPSPAEGEEECEQKKEARKLHGYNKADLARSCNIGGAIKASPEAKELLGYLRTCHHAHLIQRAMIAASSDKKKTVKAKHVKNAIATEGITTV